MSISLHENVDSHVMFLHLGVLTSSNEDLLHFHTGKLFTEQELEVLLMSELLFLLIQRDHIHFNLLFHQR